MAASPLVRSLGDVAALAGADLEAGVLDHGPCSGDAATKATALRLLLVDQSDSLHVGLKLDAVEIPEPHDLLADAERSLKLVRAYYERAGDEASLFAAGAIRWRLVALLAPIASALEAIAEWEPRDYDRFEALEAADREQLPDLYAGTAISGREAFEHDREATADLYVMADALRRAQILLGQPRRIDPERLNLPEA